MEPSNSGSLLVLEQGEVFYPSVPQNTSSKYKWNKNNNYLIVSFWQIYGQVLYGMDIYLCLEWCLETPLVIEKFQVTFVKVNTHIQIDSAHNNYTVTLILPFLASSKFLEEKFNIRIVHNLLSVLHWELSGLTWEKSHSKRVPLPLFHLCHTCVHIFPTLVSRESLIAVYFPSHFRANESTFKLKDLVYHLSTDILHINTFFVEYIL